jgi:hypothetical protein
VLRKAGVASVGGLVVMCMLVPPVHARALRAPRWLRGPYRRYELTFSASDSTSEHEVTTATTPPPGATTCDTYVTTSQFTSNPGMKSTWDFIFGHSHDSKTHKDRFAFVYQIRRKTPSGRQVRSMDSTSPAGCPPAEQPRHGSCTGTYHSAESHLDATEGRTSNIAILDLLQSVSISDHDTCTGDTVVFNHEVPEVHPDDGHLVLTASGVHARRAFHGVVHTSDDAAQSGSGSDRVSNLSEEDKVDWTLDIRRAGTFTLAPVRG